METHGQEPRPVVEDRKRDPHRLVAISLPAATWREIESTLRARGLWWLANQLVNTNSPVFSEVSSLEK